MGGLTEYAIRQIFEGKSPFKSDLWVTLLTKPMNQDLKHFYPEEEIWGYEKPKHQYEPDIMEPTDLYFKRVKISPNDWNIIHEKDLDGNIAGNALGLENSVNIQFPPVGMPWGYIYYIAVMDAEEDGNMLMFATLSNRARIGRLDTVCIAPGDLSMTLEGGYVTPPAVMTIFDKIKESVKAFVGG